MRETLKELRNRAYPGPTEMPPSQSELEAKALYFVRTCKPKEYRQMKASGELEEYCQLKANGARRYAENLMECGEPDFIAWSRAIRSEILESIED